MAKERTPDDLQQYIARHNIPARLVGDIGHTPTVPSAARALGVETEQIIKTLLFLVHKPGEPDAPPMPVVVISNGENRVDKGPLAARFGVGKKRIKLAPAEVVLDLLGYPAGGVPPFGYRTRPHVIVDAAILALDERFDGLVYAGGGDDRSMLELRVDVLLSVTQAEVLAVS